MPIQAPQWTEFLSCPICCHEFDGGQRGPISLGCGHTVCRRCLAKLQRNQCPYDQTVMRLELDQLPVNGALLSLVNGNNGSSSNSNGALSTTEIGSDQAGPQHPPPAVPPRHAPQYFSAIQCIKELALLLKPFSGSAVNGTTSLLSRPMQRKLVTLINCQLVEEEGRARAVRAARSLGERTVTELILHHQNHHLLSANLWAAVRSRGCQFLGPAMQEEVLKLVLLALEDGSPLSRKVLVMFVVQRLEPHFPQASKTSIGHVVQLLYRASCFKVSKREGDSSLMQLKEEFRTYEALRREHDAQIVQIATEAGLRIAPDQWSSLLYGDTAHKSHMQSIIDKLQTPQSFGQSVQELVIALQRTGDPGQLSSLRPQLELLAGLDPSPDAPVPGWELCASAMEAVKSVVTGLVQFIQHHGNRKITDAHHALNNKYKTSMCRDLTQRGGCPRGNDCTFAHSEDELEKYRSRNRKHGKTLTASSSAQSAKQLPLQPSYHPPPPHPQNHITSKQQEQIPPLSKQPHHSPPDEHKHLHHQPQQQPHPKHHQQQARISPNPAQPAGPIQPLAPNDMVISVLKNGERPPSIPVIAKPMIVEELLTPGIASSHTSFEPPKFMQVTPHTQTIPLIPAGPASASVIRSALPSAQTPVFAAPIAEYAHSPFYHPQPQLFAQPPPTAPPPPLTAANGPPPPVAAALHHTVPPQPLYSPQHPPPIMTPDIFPHSPHHLLVNQGTVYNIVGPRDFPGPIADTRQISSLSKSVVSSWPNVSQEEQNQSLHTDQKPLALPSTDSQQFDASDPIASKSLSELKERKQEILTQLESIVGKEATDEVASKVANGEIVSTVAPDLLPEYSSTYSIWTTGATLDFSWGKVPDKGWDPTQGYRTNQIQKVPKTKEDFIPFEPPVASRFGPICRMTLTRPFLRPSNPIQVSACSTTDPVTTPTVHRPVPAISPMPQVLYQPPGFAVGLVSYPPSLEFMNTVGHGIIDPPHLHMSQLDPTGTRPTDPLYDFLQMGQEERQRQQLIAAKEGIDGFSLQQKLEEMRLKDELNHVVQGIQEKKKELEETPQDEDFDFEKNWKFDFDEGDKE